MREDSAIPREHQDKLRGLGTYRFLIQLVDETEKSAAVARAQRLFPSAREIAVLPGVEVMDKDVWNSYKKQSSYELEFHPRSGL
jgi:hypothetical protein